MNLYMYMYINAEKARARLASINSNNANVDRKLPSRVLVCTMLRVHLWKVQRTMIDHGRLQIISSSIHRFEV